MDIFEVESEDVFMKIFMQFLIDDDREWYKSLPILSIISFQHFKRMFRDQYDDHLDSKFSLHELTNIRKNQNENVSFFNNRFIKINKIPLSMRPTNNMNLVFYFGIFDPKIGYELRSSNPPTLVAAFKLSQPI